MNDILSSSSSCTVSPPAESLLTLDCTILDKKNSNFFDDVYDIDQLINEGSYGTVFKAFHKGTNELFAVKIVDRVSQNADTVILREVSMLHDLKDIPNVVQLVDFFIDDDHMYIVQDYAKGGDVMDQLMERREKDEGGIDELNTCHLIYALLRTVKTLHQDHKIVHCDIKPDNILLKDSNDYSSMQLCDFGLASYLPKNKRASLSRRCGSLAYTAPEIMTKNKKVRQQIDMWSIGCSLFLLLCGYQAFEEETKSRTIANIKNCSYCNHHIIMSMSSSSTWNAISDEAKELIENLLLLDPKKRWTVNQALECDWITKNIVSSTDKIDNEYSTNTMTTLITTKSNSDDILFEQEPKKGKTSFFSRQRLQRTYNNLFKKNMNN